MVNLSQLMVEIGNASKSGLSHVSSLLKNQPLKAVALPANEGNIFMSNSHAALDDESEEEESFQKALAYITKILEEPNGREVLAEEFKKVGEKRKL
ncbi:hypothetical protein Tco_0517812 [Tanacetum coccineum]